MLDEPATLCNGRSVTTRTRLTTAEVAERLAYEVKTVQRKAAAGQIPGAEKLPGRTGWFLFDPEIFEEFLRTLPEREMVAAANRRYRRLARSA